VKTRRLAGFLLSVVCAFGPLARGAPASVVPLRVLIIDGFSNHDWRMTTARIRDILNRDGGFTVAVTTSPDSTAPAGAVASWQPPLDHVDVIIMNCNDLGHPVHWSDAARHSIESFVAQGGGMFALHSANNSFAAWPEYNRMIGLGWRNKDFGPALEVSPAGEIIRIPAGQGQNTSHGKRVDALVKRIGDHPIHHGLPREWRAADTEVYTYVRGPAENVTVISYSADNKFSRGFPVEWVVNYGQGRVYSSSLGHLWKGDIDPPGYRCAAFQTLLVRALRWLGHRPVEDTVPADFPTAAAVSLRAE
jgi:type 1 glutamine amidotransferase